MDAARAQARSLPQMSEIYKDIDAQANELRMANIAARILGEGVAGRFTASDAWGAIATHLRAAEAEGFNLITLITESFDDREFGTADDVGVVMAWRIENRLEHWRAQAEQQQHRPLEAVSDEALERLDRRAAGELLRAKADVGQEPGSEAPSETELVRGWRAERKETPWQRRLHGHLSDDELTTRISAAEQKARTDTTINDPAAEAKARWMASSLQKEQALRELMHPEARADEAYQRGAVSNYRRVGNTPRVQAAAQIHQRISTEIEARRHLPTPMATTPATDGLPAWLAPNDVLTHPDTPALWRQELQARRDLMATEATRLGAQLAAEPPAWAAPLGPVPSETAHQQQWRQLAVEISTYRDSYRIPASETAPIPANRQGQGIGDQLVARITAMHKYSAQTRKEPLAPADAQLMAEAAQVEALVKEAPTPAEQVVDQLRQTRRIEAEAQLSPAQERAERAAALARKVRANQRPTDQEGSGSQESAEAVKEAMENIRARRVEEETRRQQPRPDYVPEPRHGRGPGMSR
jgi:hypothetical protein